MPYSRIEFLNCTKTKIYDVISRLRLMLQTTVSYTVFVARQSYNQGYHTVLLSEICPCFAVLHLRKYNCPYF